MANANMTPMPFVRKFGSAASDSTSSTSKDGESGKKPTLASLAQSAFPSRYDPNAFVDVSGQAISAPTVTGACKRCGYPGHLYFQCRNHIEVRPNMSTKAYEVSSTSSESSDDETPLIELEKQRKKEKKLKKKEKKARKKEKKIERKEKKRKRKEEKKRRCEKDDSDDSDDESDSSEDEKRRKRSKKEKRKRRRSSSSSGSDSEDDRRDSKRRRRNDSD